MELKNPCLSIHCRDRDFLYHFETNIRKIVVCRPLVFACHIAIGTYLCCRVRYFFLNPLPPYTSPITMLIASFDPMSQATKGILKVQQPHVKLNPRNSLTTHKNNQTMVSVQKFPQKQRYPLRQLHFFASFSPIRNVSIFITGLPLFVS